jgi:hypothetical protein
MSLGSAAMSFTPTSLNGSGDQGTIVSINFTINNTATQNMTSIQTHLEDLISGSNTLLSSNLNLVDVPSYIEGLQNNNVILSVTIPLTQAIGAYTGNIIFEGTYTNSLNYTIPLTITVTEPAQEFDFCEYDDGTGSNPGDLRINIKDVTVSKGFGDDEEWFLFDEIEVEIEVENKGDDDVDDISIEWGLYNVDSDEWAIDMDEKDEFNLKDGDEEKLILTCTIDDNDLDLDLNELEDNYVLFVRATGEVDDSDIYPKTCDSDSQEIEIIIESDFVVLYDFEFQELVSCGTDVQITADVWNIGDRNQDDVYVRVYNKDLEINEKIEIGDIDALEDEKFVFEFQVPEDAEEKWYTFKFTVYDEDDDIYENDNEDKAEFSRSFKVEGGCVVEPQVMVTASLESGGKAGQELVIKATIINTGSKLTTYELNAIDYFDWATLISVEPSTIILSAGQSKDVLIIFNVDKDVSGDELFNIEVLLEDEVIATQPVSVTIEKSGFSFITGGAISENNWYLWGIGALNIVLIIIIILVALRVARK